MQHIKDIIYRGQEIIIYKDGEFYACDIRSDNFDGDIVQGYTGLSSPLTAVQVAKNYIKYGQAITIDAF